MSRARGRRPGGSHTRDDIAVAAKRQFAEFGYPRTTLRGIAREADVDTRLVTHYFGSKQHLFLTVVDLPFEPAAVVDDLLAEGPDHVGHKLATLVVTTLEDAQTRQTLTGLIRAASSEDEAADIVRLLLTDRVLVPLAHKLGSDRADLRAALIGAHLTGYVFGRHIVSLPALAEAEPRLLADAVAPVLQHYLTGSLSGQPAL